MELLLLHNAICQPARTRLARTESTWPLGHLGRWCLRCTASCGDDTCNYCRSITSDFAPACRSTKSQTAVATKPMLFPGLVRGSTGSALKSVWRSEKPYKAPSRVRRTRTSTSTGTIHRTAYYTILVLLYSSTKHRPSEGGVLACRYTGTTTLVQLYSSSTSTVQLALLLKKWYMKYDWLHSHFHVSLATLQVVGTM